MRRLSGPSGQPAPRPRRRARPQWLAPTARWTAVALVLAAAGGGVGWAIETGHVAATRDAVINGFQRLTADAGLAVDDVLVAGRVETDPRALLDAVGVERGTPILTVDLDAVRERVVALPWVKAARVERHLPDTLLVALTERRPLALWQRQGVLTLVDEDGVAIPDPRIARFGGLPVVIGDDAPARARDALAMLAREPDLLVRVRALTWVGERRWTVRLDDLQGGGIDVQLPETGAAGAWTHLARLERDHGVLKRDVMTIDLRIPDQLILRVTPDAAVRAAAPGKNT